MNHRTRIRLLLTAFLMIIAFVMAGCDWLEEDEEEVSSKKKTKIITGTAAAGLPIVGIVNVKGANGETASADIDSDGNYTLVVNGLTAPFVLMAEGTVNGESVKLYSTGVERGNINITPITNLITSKVLPDLDDAFDNWGTESTTVDEAALEAAEEEVQEQLAPILEAYGITEEIDLMSVEFDTDHSGLDAVLDIVKIEIDDSNNVTITNKATGTTVTGDEAFTEEEGTKLVTAINATTAMNVFWNKITELWADSRPTASEITETIAPLVADQYLERGMDKTAMLDRWISGDGGPAVGMTFVTSIEKDMTADDYDSNVDYVDGYWVNVHYDYDDGSGTFLTGMVYNGTNWLFYGDQTWVELSFKAKIGQYYNCDGTGECEVERVSSLQVAVRDEYNYAYDKGIRYAQLRGPGLPDASSDGYQYLTQSHQYPDNEFDNDFVILSTDAQASAIPENPEYEVFLYDTSTDVFTGTEPLKSFTKTISGKPFLPSELKASLFAVFSQPSSHDLSSLNIGGDVTVTWTNPDDCKVDYVGVSWCDDSDCQEYEKEITKGDETVTFDTSGNIITSPSYGWVGTNCKDLVGIERESGWWLE